MVTVFIYLFSFPSIILFPSYFIHYLMALYLYFSIQKYNWKRRRHSTNYLTVFKKWESKICDCLSKFLLQFLLHSPILILLKSNLTFLLIAEFVLFLFNTAFLVINNYSHFIFKKLYSSSFARCCFQHYSTFWSTACMHTHRTTWVRKINAKYNHKCKV